MGGSLSHEKKVTGFYGADFDDAATAAINSIEPSGQPYATSGFQQPFFNPNARQAAQRNTPLSPTASVAPPQRAPRRSVPGIQVTCHVPRLPNQQIAQGQRQHAHFQNTTDEVIRPNVQVVVQAFGNQMN
ncbi:hypothetical protein PHISP_01518 [Aspergillus sp. HF37]|nr:hypothetical protein PHISP_01518 [Aspergillus sp. HF37]